MTRLITIAPLDNDVRMSDLYHYKVCGLDNYWLTPDLYERGLTDGRETLTFPRLFDVQAAIGMHLCSLGRPLTGKEVRFLRTDIGYTQSELGSVLGYKDKQRVAAAEKAGETTTGRSPPLAGPADLLLRHVYLAWLGQQPLVGKDYRERALTLGRALQIPALADEQVWKVAA
jgi:transcriptional regulator with XRE-family HTH domain